MQRKREGIRKLGNVTARASNYFVKIIAYDKKISKTVDYGEFHDWFEENHCDKFRTKELASWDYWLKQCFYK